MTDSVGRVWVTSPPRYDPKRIDNMPVVGPDNFQILQDQIDALERRIERLENDREAQE